MAHPMTCARIVLTCFLVLLAADPLGAAEFYVATDGSDLSPGTKDKPFATVARARDAVRQLRGSGPPQEAVTVFLRQGTYFLPETLQLRPQDSGEKGLPVVYTSYPGEKAILSGGRPIAGLSESRDSAGGRRWTTALPGVKDGSWYFRQLFVTPAAAPSYSRRYRPQLGVKLTAGLTYSPAKKGMAHRAAQKDFIFFPGDFRAWENLSDVEVVALHTWSSSRLLVEKLDMERCVVEFTGYPTFRIGQWWAGGRNPYYIENVKEALIAPGQWYLDRKTGVFSYLPLPGETLAETRLVAPALARLVAVEGDWAQGKPVHHVVFKDLGFSHNESPLPREGYGGAQAQPELPAAIELTGAEGVQFIRSTIAHVGNYGLWLGKGCHGNRVIGCRLTDLAGGGIKVGDIGMKVSSPPPELPTDNVVENCAISDGGLMYFSANAIWAGIVRGLKLRHNEIWNFPYAGIAVGWQWNDTPTSCGSNLIENNLIHHVCTLLADGASIYTLGRQPGTVICGNVLRDNRKSRFTQEHWQLGIYLDEGSAEMLVENNLLYHVGTHGFNSNGGAQNVVRNNILGPVYGNHEPFVRCYKKPYARENLFEHNLCWCDSPNMADAVWDKGLMLCRSNLYYNIEGKPFGWKGKTFAQWQALGQDAGSLLADPQFVDPEKGDFRLKPTSPAFALGFKPFDYSRAGLEAAYQDLRAAMTVTPAPIFSMTLPPVIETPPGFALDFEDVPLGMVPRGFSTAGFSPEANFQVSTESVFRGKRALKVTDSKAAAKSFYPMLTYAPAKPLEKGKISFSCVVRLKPEAPMMLDFCFRDYTKRSQPKREFTSGPALQMQSDGRVTFGREQIARVPLGAWAHLSIEFNFQTRSGKVLVRGEGVEAGEKSIALASDFTAFTWFSIIGGQAIDGVAYLDDLKLTYAP
jgi:hypothetical protein